MNPIMTGTPAATIPAPASTTFLPKVNPRTIRFLMMASIRFFKSDPVTPEMQATGDSAYSLQTFKMPSA